MIKYLDELDEVLVKIGVDKEDICLTGSEVLALNGIRDNHDLDIIMRPEALIMHQNQFPRGYRWRVKISEHIELYRNHLHFIGISDNDIFNRGWFIIHDALKIIPIEIAYLLKKALTREKDFRDIEQIIKRFPNIEEQSTKYKQSNFKLWLMKIRSRFQI